MTLVYHAWVHTRGLKGSELTPDTAAISWGCAAATSTSNRPRSASIGPRSAVRCSASCVSTDIAPRDVGAAASTLACCVNAARSQGSREAARAGVRRSRSTSAVKNCGASAAASRATVRFSTAPLPELSTLSISTCKATHFRFKTRSGCLQLASKQSSKQSHTGP